VNKGSWRKEKLLKRRRKEEKDLPPPPLPQQPWPRLDLRRYQIPIGLTKAQSPLKMYLGVIFIFINCFSFTPERL
jgi:hypothetical protein